MAFADLSFAAALWHGRGLRYLAAPADLPPELSLCAAPSAARPAVAAGRPPRPAGHDAGPGRRPQRPQQPPQEPVPSAAAAEGRWRPLPRAELPEPWRRRLAATRPGLVAWTYWNLGPDLTAAAGDERQEDSGAEARAARRAFLGRLLRDLAHPAGTHTFWPACLPEVPEAAAPPAGGPEFAPHAEAFWSGAVHLGCRAVIVMGSAAVRALGLPGTARPLGQLRWRGQLVLVLRDVDALAGDMARYGPTLAFLRQGLGPVARLPR